MKTNKIILVATFFILLTFCNKKKEVPLTVKKESNLIDKEEPSPSYLDSPNGKYLDELFDSKKIYSLRKKMINGNNKAYFKVKDIYMFSGQGIGFTDMAIIMANKTSFPQAYYDVYESLHGIDNNYLESSKFIEVGLSKLDPETRNLAFSYLKKAAAKGHKDAIKELKKYDSKGDLRK